MLVDKRAIIFASCSGARREHIYRHSRVKLLHSPEQWTSSINGSKSPPSLFTWDLPHRSSSFLALVMTTVKKIHHPHRSSEIVFEALNLSGPKIVFFLPFDSLTAKKEPSAKPSSMHYDPISIRAGTDLKAAARHHFCRSKLQLETNLTYSK